MKLQAGLLHTNGRPISRDDLDQLLGELAGKSFEVSGEAATESLLMIYRGDRITSHEDTEVQPLEGRDFILTWDGRLDNREDFSSCFRGQNLNDIPDPAIVLKAYQQHGEAVFEKLIGEFALVLCCEKERQILFVRSTCGARPLYYTYQNATLIWSSHFGHLVRIANIDLEVNESYVLQYLVTTPDIRYTPLSKVEAIPPNHVVRFVDGQMKCGRELWNPANVAPLRYQTDRDYEEHCREKVTEAVRARLRAKGPIVAEMSGGFDSSTIALTADAILRSRNEAPYRLQTVSCVYEDSKTADERAFIRAVEEKRNVQTHLIHENDQRITLGLNNPEFIGLPTSLHCFPGRYEVISRLMRHFQSRVLLTGRGGDHLFWSAAHGEVLVADQLVRLNLTQAHRECLTWSRTANIPYFEFLAKKVLPAGVGYSGFTPQIPTWIETKYRAVILEQPAHLERWTRGGLLPSKRKQSVIVGEMFRMLGWGFGEEYPQIYASHPYSHRPLVEFILGTPVSQFLRDGETRSLMRRAFHDLLPEKLTRRVSKGLVDEAILVALQKEWSSVSDISSWQVSQRGFVVPTKLQQAVNLARLGVLGLSGALIRLFSLERWLRSLSQVASRTSRYAVQICA